MKSMFMYYGSKMRMAPLYGPPCHDLVIEPFAGSATYSLKWNCRNVRLYDIDEEICSLWDFLIHCSESDITSIPDVFANIDEVCALPPDQERLVRRWLWILPTVDNVSKLSRYEDQRDGHLMERTGRYGKYWNDRAKRRIVEQKHRIADWRIERLSYEQIPDVEAHWFVDPPYSGKEGRAYRHNEIDFDHLADWCRARQGTVDVCEKSGADWLPFTHLRTANNMGNAKYREVVWTTRRVRQMDLLDCQARQHTNAQEEVN